MTATELFVVALAIFAASIVQVVSGFGFGLLAVPLMTLAIPPREAVVVSTLLGISLSTWQAWHGRRAASAPIARRMIIGAYAGMPIGLWVFVTVDDHVLRLALGIVVLVAVGLLASRISLHRAGPSLDVVAGFISGVLNTSVSTNGPPLVFVLQARHLTPDAFRATITRVFAFSAFLGLTLFIVSGKVHRDGLVAAAISVPVMIVGQLIGFPLRRHLHGERFRVMVLALLSAAAISAIIAALA